ncbi:MAG: hypothetical protein WA061_02310 [Microgenomates group bacterium]
MNKKTNTTKSESDNDRILKQRIAELELQLENKEASGENISIASDFNVPVMSLFMGKLNLSTEGFGKGHKYWWSEFGQKKTVPYSDLAQIINAEESLLGKGYFYIMDERVIKKHGLTQTYESILDKKKLEQVFSLSPNAVELYQSANQPQKDIMNTFIIQKIVKDESIDLNVVNKISKVAGFDLFSKAQELKERQNK